MWIDQIPLQVWPPATCLFPVSACPFLLLFFLTLNQIKQEKKSCRPRKWKAIENQGKEWEQLQHLFSNLLLHRPLCAGAQGWRKPSKKKRKISRTQYSFLTRSSSPSFFFAFLHVPSSSPEKKIRSFYTSGKRKQTHHFQFGQWDCFSQNVGEWKEAMKGTIPKSVIL